jgi:NAD(P)-dependent dehydrogenase (short-subunit alcohol dehydrogenase family)
MPVAIVTGSSTGIGFATSLTLAKEDLALTALQMDVDDDKSVNDTIEKIMNDSGRIDAVVNNAGYALIGAFEESTIQDEK